MRLIDWLFRDRVRGGYTVAQFPNPPLWVAAAAWGLRLVLRPEGAAATALRALGGLALAWWAGDEVVRGVNPFRRLLGGAVLAGLIGGLVAR